MTVTRLVHTITNPYVVFVMGAWESMGDPQTIKALFIQGNKVPQPESVDSSSYSVTYLKCKGRWLEMEA